MKLTQNQMNGSCDNYDQKSDKNESKCNQAITKLPQMKTKKGGKKGKLLQKAEKVNWILDTE